MAHLQRRPRVIRPGKSLHRVWAGTQVRHAAKLWRYVDKTMKKIPMMVIAAIFLTIQVSHAETEKILTSTTGDATEIYAVIFGVTVALDGKIENIRMAKVIDPITGNMEAVDIPVPEIYVKSAKQLIETKQYKAKVQNGIPVEFFTYFFYDPSHPEIVITEIKK